MAYSPVTWNTTNNVNCSINNTTGTVTGFSASTFSSVAQTTDTFGSGNQIKITGWTADDQVVGLGHDPFIISGSNQYSSVEFGVNFVGGQFHIYETGSYVASQSGSTSDYIEILNDNGTIKYYQNGTLWHTSTQSPTGTLYGHCALRHASSITCEIDTVSTGGGGSGGGSGGSGGSGGNDVIQGEGNYIDHILYMQTVVPR